MNTTDDTNATAAAGPVLSEGLGGNADKLRRDHGAAAARRKFFDLPETHRVCGWEMLGGGCVRYSFAACSKDLLDDKLVWGPATHSTVVTDEETQAEFARVEREDRQCAACVDGKEWSGWNHITGHRFTTCARCGGTALPPNVRGSNRGLGPSTN